MLLLPTGIDADGDDDTIDYILYNIDDVFVGSISFIAHRIYKLNKVECKQRKNML